MEKELSFDYLSKRIKRFLNPISDSMVKAIYDKYMASASPSGSRFNIEDWLLRHVDYKHLVKPFYKGKIVCIYGMEESYENTVIIVREDTPSFVTITSSDGMTKKVLKNKLYLVTS
jgi:hypothetical protein